MWLLTRIARIAKWRVRLTLQGLSMITVARSLRRKWWQGVAVGFLAAILLVLVVALVFFGPDG